MINLPQPALEVIPAGSDGLTFKAHVACLMAPGTKLFTEDQVNVTVNEEVERLRKLLERAFVALHYHREMTRPISQTDSVIDALMHELIEVKK